MWVEIYKLVIKLSEKEKKEVETTVEGTDDEKDEEDVEVMEKKTKTRKLQINISRDKEVEALQKEKLELESRLKRMEEESEVAKQKMEDEKTTIQEQLDEKQAILEKQALEAFEKDKNELLMLAKNSNLTDEQMADIEERLTTPEKLEMVKGLITMLVPKTEEKDTVGKGEEKKIPEGKATITQLERRGDSKVYESPEALISDLYWKAYYARDNQVTVQERRDARDKITQLLNDMIGGKGWKELKEGVRMPEGKISYCPKCYQVIVGVHEKCPHCGHDLQEKLRKQEEESSKW